MINVRDFPELQTLSLDDQYSILRRCRQRALMQIFKSSLGVVVVLLLTLNLLLLTATLLLWPFVLLVFVVVVFWLRAEVRNRMHNLVYVEARVYRLMQRKESVQAPTWLSGLSADVGD